MNIVIIEDNPSYVKHAVDQLCDHTLHIIPTMREAISYLKELRVNKLSVDALLTDCMLPDEPNNRHVDVIRNIHTPGCYEQYEQEMQEEDKRMREKWIEDLRKDREETDFSRLQKENEKLEKDLHQECPVGYQFLMEAIFLGIPFVGMLKGIGHGMPPVGWCAWKLFYDEPDSIGGTQSHPSPEEWRSYCRKVTIGASKVIIGEGGYCDIIHSDNSLSAIKRWDIILNDLSQL